MKIVKACIGFIREQITSFHPFSRYILHGSLQFTAVLYLAAGITYRVASYVPDYFQALTYSDGFLSIAPVTLASGIIAALISDLVLRKSNADKKEK